MFILFHFFFFQGLNGSRGAVGLKVSYCCVFFLFVFFFLFFFFLLETNLRKKNFEQFVFLENHYYCTFTLWVAHMTKRKVDFLILCLLACSVTITSINNSFVLIVLFSLSIIWYIFLLYY